LRLVQATPGTVMATARTPSASIPATVAAVTGSLHVWSTCHGLAMLLLDKAVPPQVDPDQAVEAVTRMVLAGLQSDT
jgi:hypothetical protein